MPVRFQVDPDFYDHPKCIGMSDAATALWVRAGSFSAAKLTDGFIADNVLGMLTREPEAAPAELIARGLWKRAKGGYRFHEWDGRNLTRQGVDTYRQRDRDRKRSSRLGVTASHTCHGCGHTYVTARSDSKFCSDACRKRANRAEQNVNPQVETEVVRSESERNPDGIQEDSTGIPTPVVLSCVESVSVSSEAAQSAPKTKRGTRIPDDFTVTEAMKEWVRERVPHVDGWAETEKFINYWRAKSGKDATKIDWVATWRNWMLNAAERAPKPQPNSRGRRIQDSWMDTVR